MPIWECWKLLTVGRKRTYWRGSVSSRLAIAVEQRLFQGPEVGSHVQPLSSPYTDSEISRRLTVL